MIIIKHSRNILKKPYLHTPLKYNYLTPVDKPILSVAVTSLIQSSSELMQYVNIEGNLCGEISVFAGAFVFRILAEGAAIIVRNMQERSKATLPSIKEEFHVAKQQSFLHRFVDRWFVVDMVRDYKFYNLPQKLLHLHVSYYYRPSYIVSSIFTSYLLLNFMRGGHWILSKSEFNSFCLDTMYLPSLASHDPHFFTPILVIGLTYHLLRGSHHPFFIHLRQKQNWISSLNIAFMAGLAFVPLPGLYHFAYLGIGLAHCALRFPIKLSLQLKLFFK